MKSNLGQCNNRIIKTNTAEIDLKNTNGSLTEYG